MSKNKIPSVRGIHVSPGIYTAESELSYAVKSLGITTLGLVGETMKGPAFQPVPIKDWREFTSMFGGTNPEKFKGSQYPKYELPYIAKSYLSESNQLQVCRVLGLSGYNAGPAWIVAANYDSDSVFVTATTDATHYKKGGEYVPIASVAKYRVTEINNTNSNTTFFYEKNGNVYDFKHEVRYKKVGDEYQKDILGEYVYVNGRYIKDTLPNTTKRYTITYDKTAGTLYKKSPIQYGEISSLTKYKISENSVKVPIAVLRSRGYYEQYRNVTREEGNCCENVVYDGLTYLVGETTSNATNCDAIKKYNMGALSITEYTNLATNNTDCSNYNLIGGENEGYTVNTLNYGRFTICGLTGKTDGTETAGVDNYHFRYSVSLNPNDKDYILKVLGTDPQNSSAEIYVEALYDVALRQGIEEGKISSIHTSLIPYEPFNIKDYCTIQPVIALMTIEEAGLKRKDVGKRFLVGKYAVEKGIGYHTLNTSTKRYNTVATPVAVGDICVVKQQTDERGKRHYYYVNVDNIYKFNTTNVTDNEESKKKILVKNLSDGLYYRTYNNGGTLESVAVGCDMNNYRDSYRYASTPWIVSNIKGDYNKIEMTKMFRFHTISDGNESNNEIKVSIVNIKPEEGTFDVYVRDINDSDDAPIILERYGRCTMIPNDSRYIGFLIGTFDGAYESKSKYITVEVNEDSLVAKTSVPAGFLGYPLSKFDGVQVNASRQDDMMAPKIKYNCDFNEDVKHRKQYFGLSDIVGVDIDSFTYKGQAAYVEHPSYLSDGFHLDCRVAKESYNEGSNDTIISVDGETGYTWQTVNIMARTNSLDKAPIVDKESEMVGSIFEYVDLRKFTVYFYGGFDGWDVYRASRSNTDDFKQTKYKGDYNDISGEGYSFNRINNPELLQLNQKGITSDWYAYLSAIRQFANPENVDINVFATPGIDLINNKLLCQEAIDMIEEERADSIYVATIPDKPFGATDFESDMYLPDDLVEELEETEIDSNYTCTYYPWVKYEDVDNNQFIMLPPTKDVVRNMAMTDNTAQPWFSPAGVTRGNVDCVRAHKVTKIADEDVLYEGRINPVKTFASDGVKIWGNKNLQHGDALLTRIHVRRLLLRMRKLISIACIGLIFEPNDNTVKSRFLSLVTPIMDSIKSNRGISDYRIEVDDSIETRERRELNAKIFFKPYNSLEYIGLTFVVTPQQVSFDEL